MLLKVANLMKRVVNVVISVLFFMLFACQPSTAHKFSGDPVPREPKLENVEFLKQYGIEVLARVEKVDASLSFRSIQIIVAPNVPVSKGGNISIGIVSPDSDFAVNVRNPISGTAHTYIYEIPLHAYLVFTVLSGMDGYSEIYLIGIPDNSLLERSLEIRN